MSKRKGERAKAVPEDIRAIVGDADPAERAWIADRLEEMARRIRATVPATKNAEKRRSGRLAPSRWGSRVSRASLK